MKREGILGKKKKMFNSLVIKIIMYVRCSKGFIKIREKLQRRVIGNVSGQDISEH